MARSAVVRPSWVWFTLLDGGIVALSVFSASAGAHTAAAEASPLPLPLPSRRTCQQLLVGTAIIHLAEAAVAGRLARRRGLSPWGWRSQTFVVGFPSLLALRRVTRAAGAPAAASSDRP